MALVPDESAVQQLASAGLDPAFHDRVHSRRPDAALDDLQSGIGQHGVEGLGELGVPVTNQELALLPASCRSTPCSRRISQTVEAATLIPNAASSPQAQHKGADRADRGWASVPFRRAVRGMAPVEQVAVPVQDRVRPHE